MNAPLYLISLREGRRVYKVQHEGPSPGVVGQGEQQVLLGAEHPGAPGQRQDLGGGCYLVCLTRSCIPNTHLCLRPLLVVGAVSLTHTCVSAHCLWWVLRLWWMRMFPASSTLSVLAVADNLRTLSSRGNST